MGRLITAIGHARSLEWLATKIIPFIILITGGSIQVGLAKITPWLEQIGPIIYSVLFFAGAFASLSAYWLYLSTYKKQAIINHAKSIAGDSQTNPLENKFDKKIINTSEFYSPFYIPHKNKTFTDCHVLGTTAIVLIGCTLKDITFTDNQIILVREKIPIKNATAFIDCTFLQGRFINCTIFMTTRMFNELPDYAKQNIPVISTNI